MKVNYLRIETSRDGYTETQVVDNAITVKELIKILENEDEDMLLDIEDLFLEED